MYIYLTTNLITGKMYVGQRRRPPENDPYLGSGVLLRRAVQKYGAENFVKVVLAVAEDEEELNKLERAAIAERDAVQSEDYYNLAPGGTFNSWDSISDEERVSRGRKISAALKGRPKSETHKQKLSEVKKGCKKVWGVVTREMYSQRRKQEVAQGINVPPVGNAGNKDFRHTEETKARSGASVKAAHERAASEGRAYHSPEGQEALRERAIKTIASPEFIEKRREMPGYQKQLQDRRDAGNERYADLPEMLKTMTQSEIAAVLGVDQAAVAQRIRIHNIPVEHTEVYHEKVLGKRQSAAKLAHEARREQGDKTWEGFDLPTLYIGRTQADVAKIVGVSQVRVSQRLKQLGITKVDGVVYVGGVAHTPP